MLLRSTAFKQLRITGISFILSDDLGGGSRLDEMGLPHRVQMKKVQFPRGIPESNYKVSSSRRCHSFCNKKGHWHIQFHVICHHSPNIPTPHFKTVTGEKARVDTQASGRKLLCLAKQWVIRETDPRCVFWHGHIASVSSSGVKCQICSRCRGLSENVTLQSTGKQPLPRDLQGRGRILFFIETHNDGYLSLGLRLQWSLRGELCHQ